MEEHTFTCAAPEAGGFVDGGRQPSEAGSEAPSASSATDTSSVVGDDMEVATFVLRRVPPQAEWIDSPDLGRSVAAIQELQGTSVSGMLRGDLGERLASWRFDAVKRRSEGGDPDAESEDDMCGGVDLLTPSPSPSPLPSSPPPPLEPTPPPPPPPAADVQLEECTFETRMDPDQALEATEEDLRGPGSPIVQYVPAGTLTLDEEPLAGFGGGIGELAFKPTASDGCYTGSPPSARLPEPKAPRAAGLGLGKSAGRALGKRASLGLGILGGKKKSWATGEGSDQLIGGDRDEEAACEGRGAGSGAPDDDFVLRVVDAATGKTYLVSSITGGLVAENAKDERVLRRGSTVSGDGAPAAAVPAKHAGRRASLLQRLRRTATG